MKRIIAVALILSGCSPMPEGRFIDASGRPPADRDVKECEYEQVKADPENAGMGLWILGAAPTVMKRCLELRGYKDTATGPLSY